MNEPNLDSWLRPQWTRVGRATIDAGAVLLPQAGTDRIAGLRASGHGAHQILLGETSPTGRLSGRSRLRPCASPHASSAWTTAACCCAAPTRRGTSARARSGSRSPATRPPVHRRRLPPARRDGAERRRGHARVHRPARYPAGPRQAPPSPPQRRAPSGTPSTASRPAAPDPYGVSPSGQAFYLDQSEYISWLEPWAAQLRPVRPGRRPRPGLVQHGADLTHGHGARKPAYDALVTRSPPAGGGAVSVWAAPGAPARRGMQSDVAARLGAVATVRTGRDHFLRRASDAARRWRLLRDPAARHASDARRRARARSLAPDELLVRDAVRAVGVVAQPLAPRRSRRPRSCPRTRATCESPSKASMWVAIAVEEPAVVGDDHGAAGEVEQRLLERAQGVDVEVVGRLVEQQQVAAAAQQLGQVDAVALAAGELADLLLLVGARGS